MKKVLSALVILAMLIIMLSVVSNAGHAICFDGAFLTNNASVNTHVPAEGEKDVKSGAVGGDLGNLYGLGYSYIHFQGWIGNDDDFSDLGYSVNDGEITWGKGIYDAAILGESKPTGFQYALRYNFNLPIQEGTITVKFYAKMAADESAQVMHTIKYINDANVVTYTWADGATESNIGLWLRNLNDKAVAKFTTKCEFDAVRLPIYWASTMANQGATPNFTISIYANAGNVDRSLDAAPLASKAFEAVGDNNPAAVFELDSALPAGTYYFVVETTGTNGKDFDGTSSSAYLVIPTASTGVGDYFNILATGKHAGDAINFSIRAAEANPFDTNPAEEAVPDMANIDFVLLFNGAAFTENLGKGGNLGQLKKAYEAGGTQLYLVGWYLPVSNIADFAYQIDDNAPVYHSFNITFEQGTADIITSWNYEGNRYRKFDGLIPLQEGQHTVKLIVKLTSGRTKVIYQTSYKNDDTDIALDKPVYIDLISGVRNGSGYWLDEYVNDGYNPVHNPAVVADPVPLGFYPVGTTVHAKIYIDLQGVYDLSEIDIHPQGFQNVTFPSAYDLYTSLDGVNWDLITSVEGRSGDIDSANPFVFETTNRARYILFEIKEGVALDDSGYKYASVGEIEAYGTFVEDSTDKAPYLPFKTYEGDANTGDAGGLSSWTGFSTGTLTHSFVFNTDVSFYRIGFPAFWGAPNTPLTFEFIKDGETVLTQNYTIPGDGAFTLTLDKTLEAGEYTLKITINDDSTDSATGYYNKYFVIGYANNNMLGNDYVACERGQIAFDIFSDDQGEGFIRREYKQHVQVDTIQLDGADQGTADNLNITTDENSKEILVHGWLASNFPIEKYGYKIDGGETVYDDSFIVTDPGTADAPNADYFAIMNVARNLYSAAGNGYRANVRVPVTEGQHTVQIVAFVDGEDRVMRTITFAPKEAFVEVMSRDQVTIDGVDKASFGGNAEVTDIADNLYAEYGKQLRIWGWYGNNQALDKYGVKVDGGEIVYFDRYEAQDIVDHIKNNLIKNQDVFASRFEIFVDITEGKHVAEVFAIVDGEEHLVWTINYTCLPEEVPMSTEDQPQTGDAAMAMFAVIAVLAMGVAVVFMKKRAF
ncbi:MAG: discoidin domain-containing protein [Clostridia bacterium]|nr:discoidin domain-containing protein [Clostridia bacterium]